MLDLKYVVENIDEVVKKLEKRQGDFSYLRKLVDLQNERKQIILDVESLKAKRNESSKQIGQLKRNKQDASHVLKEVAHIGDDIKALDIKLIEVEKEIKDILDVTPNIPSDDTPVGVDENDNEIVRVVGKPKEFDFKIKDHVELAQQLNILDFERAAKVTGTRFVFDRGLGARLERALIQFMMDMHAIDHGYTEIMTPYIVNADSMYGTGQFPKFREDAFRLDFEGHDYYLNPTAEVPTINMYRNEIISNDDLPLKFCAYSTAFRSEAGSAGRDTRGILRQHQFHKVELIKFVKPEESYQALEDMLKHSEEVLKRLEIPYRVVNLSTGDLGFGATKTYDIEVWLPGQDKYREIGSISNDEDFQARRANIRFKRSNDAKTEYVHTLNGSGLAVGRTMIAVIENYQNADGSITIPKALRPYMKVDKIA